MYFSLGRIKAFFVEFINKQKIVILVNRVTGLSKGG